MTSINDSLVRRSIDPSKTRLRAMSQLNDNDAGVSTEKQRAESELGEHKLQKSSKSNLNDHLSNYRIRQTTGYGSLQGGSVERPASYYFPKLANQTGSVRNSQEGSLSRKNISTLQKSPPENMNGSRSRISIGQSKQQLVNRSPLNHKSESDTRPESPFHFSEQSMKYKDQIQQEEQQIFQQLDQIRVKINNNAQKKGPGQFLSDQKQKMRLTRGNMPIKLSSIENYPSVQALQSQQSNENVSPPPRSSQLNDLTASNTVNKTIPTRRLRAPLESSLTEKKAAQLQNQEESPNQQQPVIIHRGKPTPSQTQNYGERTQGSVSPSGESNTQIPLSAYQIQNKHGKDEKSQILRPASIITPHIPVQQDDKQNQAAKRRPSPHYSGQNVSEQQQKQPEKQQPAPDKDANEIAAKKKGNSAFVSAYTPSADKGSESDSNQNDGSSNDNTRQFGSSTGFEVGKINTSRINCMNMLENLKKMIKSTNTTQFSASSQQFYQPKQE